MQYKENIKKITTFFLIFLVHKNEPRIELYQCLSRRVAKGGDDFPPCPT